MVELSFGRNKQDRFCILGKREEPSQGKLEALARNLGIQKIPVSCSLSQENKWNGRQDPGLGLQIEHIYILHGCGLS